ncbi:tRNA glutamyl-Q(34) synthetase GluQRS [Prosthecomicrobium sp. N25]|uniref:tRNA glutamyl-Q(34) synthetase GluQRS n=1 Tax=Prosthecomicrobium sp. N25 TaxID=3129254 RepID=UPI003076B10A
MSRPVFRFAPSPNGELHLGHAYSALVDYEAAQAADGRFLLRIEDIDVTRCRPDYVERIFEDLAWLGIRWEEPVRRQSEHFQDYRAALGILQDRGLVYPAFLSRGEIRARVEAAEAAGRPWSRDPDGAPLYPGDDRAMEPDRAAALITAGRPFAYRLRMAEALATAGGPPVFREHGSGPAGETGVVATDPARWGDVILARREIPTSYHLSVVVDDAAQGVTHVVRGQDLFHATSVHRLLQVLLGLPAPVYRHHRLIVDENGRKLSKSQRDTSLRALREAGARPEDIRRMVGLA